MRRWQRTFQKLHFPLSQNKILGTRLNDTTIFKTLLHHYDATKMETFTTVSDLIEMLFSSPRSFRSLSLPPPSHPSLSGGLRLDSHPNQPTGGGNCMDQLE